MTINKEPSLLYTIGLGKIGDDTQVLLVLDKEGIYLNKQGCETFMKLMAIAYSEIAEDQVTNNSPFMCTRGKL
jgi:hypothetical protein